MTDTRGTDMMSAMNSATTAIVPAASTDSEPSSAETGTQRVRPGDLAHVIPGHRDPLGILARQNETRVPDLVPLRMERMATSPFAFYRGTAAIMAADQARDPHSGILVASCGDAHLSNFGFYASPQRTLLFDLNDFDESAWAPWEWDLKRLVTSVVIGGRASERAESVIENAAREAVAAYIRALRQALSQSPLERYFSHFDAGAARKHVDRASRKALDAAMTDAHKRTGRRAVRRLTTQCEDGTWQFVEAPPVMIRAKAEISARIENDYNQYRHSANVDIRVLLSQFTVDDVARRAVGVGSVGTRCYLALLRDRDDHALVLQVKQAGRSVLEEYGGIEQPSGVDEVITAGGEGSRVVGLQRILQAYSDPFLGHLRAPDGDFYVRQFHDVKGGIEVELLEDVSFRRYGTACAVVLARAHAQSPAASEVVRYIGKGRRVTDSIVAWSEAYAARSLADYQQFVSSLSAPSPSA